MANDTQVTVVGNLVEDPSLRFTQSGTPVAGFTIASTPRSFDKQTGQWRDGETLFLRCTVWREYAENVADSLRKGMSVIAQGRLVQRGYEKDGEKRTSYEVQVEEIGPTLRFAKAQVTRAPNHGAGQPQNAPQPAGQANAYPHTQAPF